MSISCVKCNYAVTEPLCAYCVVDEVRIWFYKKRVKKKIIRNINKKLKNLSEEVESLDYVMPPFKNGEDENIMKCIKCSKEMHLMCFYCVNNEASKIVKNNIRSSTFKESFEESFNPGFYEYKLNWDYY